MSRHSSTAWAVTHGGPSTVEGHPLTDGRRRLMWVGFERIGLLQSWFFCSLLGACPSNPKIGVWGSLFTPDHRAIVNPEPIVCGENFHL